MIVELTHDSPYKASILNWTTSIVISLSVASSLFSTFDLVNFVPLALGFGSAIGQFISHKVGGLETEMKCYPDFPLTVSLHSSFPTFPPIAI